MKTSTATSSRRFRLAQTGVAAVLAFTASKTTVRAQIAGYDFTGESSPTTSTADLYNPNLDSASTLIRGAGAPSSTGGNSFRTQGFQNNGISTSNTDYFQFSLSAASGFTLSLNSIDAKYVGTATYYANPGASTQFAYSLDGGAFTLIGTAQLITASNLATAPQISLSGISALQNVADTSTVTFRFYASGQTSTGGFGFNSPSSGQYGLAIGGNLTPTGPVPAPNYFDTNGSATGIGINGGNSPVFDTTTANFTPTADGMGTPKVFDSSQVGIFGGTAGAVAVSTVTANGGLRFITNGYTFNGGTLTLGTAPTVEVTTATDTATINTQLSGAAGLTKTGAGTLVLSGANNYTGATNVGAGTLQVGVANSLPAGTAVTAGTSGATANPGILNLNGLSQAIASLTLLGGDTSSANSGVVTIGTNGILTVNGSVTYETGSNNRYPSSITGGTLNLGGATRTFAVNDNNNSTNDLDVTSVITNGGITKTLGGILRLSAANTLNGITTVSTGTLALNNVNALQNSTLDTGTSGTQSVTFVVANTNTYNLGGLQGSDALAIGANGLSVGSNSSNTSMAGIISGTGGALTKTGNGALTLTGANTYTGGTTITGGKLLVANTTGSATGTAGVSIGTAGTLASGTTGIITGLVTTAGAGSTLAPGATAISNTGTVGTLTLSGGLNAANGSRFVFDLGSVSSDLIALGSGVFTAPTAVNSALLGFNFNNSGGVAADTNYQLLTFASALNADVGDFTALTLPSGFTTATFTVTGTSVNVSFTPVPEPATVAAGLLALGTLGWSQRRRVRGFLAARRRRALPLTA